MVDRIARFAELAKTKPGTGCKWATTLSDGRPQQYEIKNIRDLSTLDHDVATWCVWIWSLKDYVREEARLNGRPESWWKAIVKGSRALMICADLANREKHGKAPNQDQAWTTDDPRFEPGRATIPQVALRALLVLDSEIVIDIGNPSLVEFEVPVVTSSGELLGDALELLDQAMDAWNTALLELSRSA